MFTIDFTGTKGTIGAINTFGDYEITVDLNTSEVYLDPFPLGAFDDEMLYGFEAWEATLRRVDGQNFNLESFNVSSVDVFGSDGLIVNGANGGEFLSLTKDQLDTKASFDASLFEDVKSVVFSGQGTGFTGIDDLVVSAVSAPPPPPPTVTDPVINEFVINHDPNNGPSTFPSATEGEFVEIFGAPNTDYSDLTLIEIEGDATGAGQGTIEEVIPLGTTDANGFWSTLNLIGPREDGTITWMIVEGFTGTVGDDVDTDNDGVIDTAPWSRIIDDVARDDGINPSTVVEDLTYSTTVIQGVDTGGEPIPGGASRIVDGQDTDSLNDWVANDYGGNGIPGFTDATVDPGLAVNTPGAANVITPDVSTYSIAAVTDPAEIVEGDSGSTGIRFAITRTGDTSQFEQIDVTLGGDVDGADATPFQTLTLSFFPDRDTVFFNALVFGDTDIEPDEVATATLSNPTNGGIIDTGVASVTILNDDTVTKEVSLSVSRETGSEANQTVITVTATADGPVSGDQTVDLSVAGASITAGDFTLSDSVITIPDGATEGSVTFTIVDDANVEAGEIAQLAISNPSGGIALGATTTQDITIADNDRATVSIPADTIDVKEGESVDIEATLTIADGGVLERQVSASMVGNVDFTASTALFNPGSGDGDKRLITVSGTDDAFLETDFEIFAFGADSRLTGTSAGADVSFVGTPIVRVEDADVVTFSFAPATPDPIRLSEGGPVNVVSVDISFGEMGTTTVIPLEITLLTNDDFTVKPVPIPVGTGAGTTGLIVEDVDDVLAEGTESFPNVRLTGTLADNVFYEGTRTVEIEDNDDAPAVTLSVDDDDVFEAGETQITLTVTAAVPVVGDQTVDVEVTGTDVTGGDFVLGSATVTIRDGETQGSTTFRAQDDALDEAPQEVATLTLVNPSSGISLGLNNSQLVTIVDNDVTAPSVPDLVDESDTGISGTDDITRDDTPTFTGTARAGEAIELQANGAKIGSGRADENGDWTITSSPLADGTYDIVARVSGPLAGPALEVTIDTEAPVEFTTEGPQTLDVRMPTLTLDQTVQSVGTFPSSTSSISTPGFLGQIRTFAHTSTDNIDASGQPVSIALNSALYSVIGDAFGGDGRFNFEAPDLDGRLAVGAGSAPGLEPVAFASEFGQDFQPINRDNLPEAAGGQAAPVDAHEGSTGINYWIVTQGSFPSRNGNHVGTPASSELMLGQIVATASDLPISQPRNMLEADGRLLQISDNPALYSLLGTSYGGDGRNTFALPDLRGRVPVGQGELPDGTRLKVGDRIGSDELTLGLENLPADVPGGAGEAPDAAQPGLVITYLVSGGTLPSSSDPAPEAPTLGEIVMFAGTFAPRGFATAEGQPVQITSNPSLYSLLGDTFGGNNTTLFNLPDLTGRTVIGDGANGGEIGDTTQNSALLAGQVIPRLPSVTAIMDDTGASSTDGVTSDATIEIFGKADPNEYVQVSLNGAPIGFAQADAAGEWRFDYTGDTLVDGVYQITAMIADAAGNVTGLASAPFVARIDTQKPAAPGTPDLDPFFDSGRSNSDDVTFEQFPEFSGGSVEAGAEIELFSDIDGSLGKVTANPIGGWGLTASQMSEGTHQITAVQTDLAGNVSDPSAALTVEIDVTAPAKPDAPDLEAGSDTGISDTDNITGDTRPTVSGTGVEAGARVEVSANFVGQSFQSVTGLLAGPDGSYSANLQLGSPGPGDWEIAAAVEDRAGNLSAPSDVLTITVDPDADAPFVTSIAQQNPNASPTNFDQLTYRVTFSEDVSGVDSTDFVVTGGTTGFVAPFGVTQVSGSVYDVEIANGDLAGFNGLVGLDLIDDDTIQSVATGLKLGGTGIANGSATAPLPYLLDNFVETPSVPDLLATSDSNIDDDNITNDDSPTFTGTAAAGDTVRLLFDGVDLAHTQANSSGAWTLTPIPTIGDGTYVIRAESEDAVGNTSQSAGLSLTIDTRPPAPPVVAAIETDSGDIGDGETTPDATVTIKGTGEAGATVEVAINGVILGLAVVDNNGEWRFDNTGTPLSTGVQSVTAQQFDVAGNPSALSGGFAFTVGGNSAPDVVVPSLVETPENQIETGLIPQITDPDGNPFTVALGGTDGALFEFDAVTGELTFKTAPDFEQPGSADGDNDYQITITADDGDLSDTEAVTVRVTDVLPIEIVLGPEDDTYYGTPEDDFISGNGGDDLIFGQGGDDILKGGGGEDELRGGGGNDRLAGGNGNDLLQGGSGDDALLGGLGDDRLVGGLGNDRLVGSDGNDRLVGSQGDNVLFGGADADTFVINSASTGLNTIRDFEIGVDKVKLNGVTVTGVTEDSNGRATAALDTGGSILFTTLGQVEVEDLFGL